MLPELADLVLDNRLPLPRLAAQQANLPDNVGRVWRQVDAREL
jgi:hypothetical protein